jgi:hypothetical protein
MTADLRDIIVDSADQVLYDEARRCIDAGAFRAAYVMSWIAAAEGILGKLRIMASLHAALGTFVGDFEQKQRDGTAKDVELIDQAFKIGLIDATERIALNAIRDLRNQYGHPTSASPDGDAAASALRTAVTAVLAKQPLIMHGAARELAQRAASDRHLVPADHDAVDGFVAARAPLFHPDARAIFVRELLKGANDKLGDPNAEILVDRCIRFATRTVAAWAEPLTGGKWNVDQMQLAWPAAAAAALVTPDVWPLLEDEDRDRLLSRCLDTNTAAAFTRNPGRLLAQADEVWGADLLTESQGGRVREALTAADPWRLLGSDVRYEHVARAIVSRLEHASFNVAGEGVDLLRSSEQSALATLDDRLQFEVGKALAHAAEQNTWSAINEIEAMPEALERWPVAMRRGVVVGGLVGRSVPLRHEETSKAALRLALGDETGDLAEAALQALTPDRLEFAASPSLLATLRAILSTAASTPAAQTLSEFIDRIERGAGGPSIALRDFD